MLYIDSAKISGSLFLTQFLAAWAGNRETWDTGIFRDIISAPDPR
jgi:hypothetical protein